MAKIVNLANFGEIVACGKIVLPDKSECNKVNVGEKCQNGEMDELLNFSLRSNSVTRQYLSRQKFIKNAKTKVQFLYEMQHFETFCQILVQNLLGHVVYYFITN